MSGGAWMFVWMMLILKIPIIALLCLVYWAVKNSGDAEPEAVLDPDRGHRPNRPSPRHPPRPRRGGTHAAPRPRAPSRVRARARKLTPSHD